MFKFLVYFCYSNKDKFIIFTDNISLLIEHILLILTKLIFFEIIVTFY